jgi:hypothetical protein
VARPRHENRVKIILLNQTVKMDIGERLAGIRAPVSQ